MKKVTQWFVFMCAFVYCVAIAAAQCQHAVTKASGPRMKADKVVAVSKANPSFTVTLPSNATTGFSWFMTRCNHKLITPEGASYIAPKNTKMVGAPGHMQWRFKVTPLGLSVPRVMKIVLVYARPWQPMATARHYRIAVVSQ